jgi:uncharacterized protein with gpF-like domain
VVKRRKAKVIWRGKVLRPSAAIQQKYLAKINAMVDAMIKETRREVEKLFDQDYAHEHFGTDSVGIDAAPLASQTRILTNRLKKKYDQLFGKNAFGISDMMVDATNRHSFATSMAAAKDLPTLRDVGAKLTLNFKNLDAPTRNILKSSADRSADFIKTIPEKYLNSVSQAMFTSVTSGNGMQDLIPFFEKFDTGTKNWVHNTAMDQTRKTYQGLSIGRMKKVGVKKGEWIHSGGSQHPRPLHEAFDGKTFDLDVGAPIGDDDDNVLPGDDVNCRCSFVPVIEDDDDSTQDIDDDEE